MPKTEEQVFIKVDGEQLELGSGKLISVVIDQALDMPDYAIITLADGMEWIKKKTFEPGKEVKIDLKHGDKRDTMFIGEVTGAEPNYSAKNQVGLSIRCFDRSHRLLRGRKSKTYQQVKDSDIVQRVAGDYGLGTDIEATDIVYQHVYQHSQTDLEFLRQRAGRIGYQVGVNDKNLYFKKKGQPTRAGASATPVDLKWGTGLTKFQARLSSASQVKKVNVRGWNPTKKEAVIGEATSSQTGPENGMGRGGGTVDSVFGTDATMIFESEYPIYSQEEADSVAQAKLDEIQVDFITAEGHADGNPAIQPGAKVKISGLDRFDGQYLIADAQHSFRKDGYDTRFRVGHGDPKLGQAAGANAAPSFAIGIVTNNVDPENSGRVRVKLPTLGENMETDWARIVAPSAGNDRGMFWLPEVNDEVLVAFQQGQSARPLILGALWNGMDRQPVSGNQAVKDGKVVQRMLKSRAGHTILLDDTDGDEKVSIEDKKGNKIVFECQGDKLVIDFAGDIEIKAKQNIKIEAGMDVSIEAGVNFKAKGGAQTSIEGATTSVKGTGPLQLQGVPVNVNNGAITVV